MRSEHTPQKTRPVAYDFSKKLEHWIDSGVWPEGGLLPTWDELALIFGASELEHAHEVLDGLHRRGILTARPADGRLVIAVKGGAQDSSTLAATQGSPEPDGERWRLVSETRRALLTQAARLAATRASADGLARLDALLAVDVEPSGAPGEDFEREVIVASGNELMLRIYDRLSLLEDMTRTADDAPAVDFPRVRFARGELLRAITARQPTAAALLADRIP